MSTFQEILPWLILGAVASNGSLLAFLFSQIGRKDATTRWFIGASAVVFGWTLVNFLNSTTHLVVFARLAYATGAWVFPAFFIWALHFTHEKKPPRRLAFVLCAAAALVSVSAFAGGLLIAGLESNPVLGTIPVFGPALPFALAVIFGSYGFVLTRLIRGYRHANDATKKSQLLLIIAGFVLFGSISLAANFVLPFFGHNYLIDFDVPGSIFLVGSIVYAISKYRLFNTKLLLAHVAVVVLWVILIAQIATGNPDEQFIRLVTLALSIAFGVVLIRSVSKEVRQREKLEELAARLRDFVSFASHELRGPVAKFKAVISMIFEGDFGEIPKPMETILRDTFIEAEDMGQTIDMFLNLNRMETGQFALNFADNDVAALAAGIVEQSRYAAQKKRLSLSFKPRASPAVISCDLFAVQHVIKNILSNAIKYTPDGGKIEILVEAKPDGVAFSCTDNGIGMDADALAKFFTKYERSSVSLARKIEGHGLGMWLSKQIIDLHGGEISVASEGVGKGTTLSFMLPKKRR